MTVATMLRQTRTLRLALQRKRPTASPLLAAIREDPAAILAQAGMEADPWQTETLRCSDSRILILASRQIGKSFVAGALALREALLRPGSLTLLVSPTLRQSGELFRSKVMMFYSALGRPLEAANESALRLELSNGSRIISLPGVEATVRCYAAVSLLVLDEAARVPDELYHGLRPMLATSRGKLVLLSSAYARQGFFFNEWCHGGDAWRRVKIMAHECRRISPDFLDEERRVMGPRIFAREYECEFCSADDAVFDFDSVKAAMRTGSEPPLF
jgi:hypothetical protein